jgi:hypothetical protein
MNSTSKDWYLFLKSVGHNEDSVKHYMDNVIDSPGFKVIAGDVINVKSKKYIKKTSDIHGKGMFALKYIKRGDTIGVVLGLKNNKQYRSYLGRFTNHSNLKNTKFEKLNNQEVTAICLHDIEIGEEILVDYRDHWGMF